MRKLPNNIFFGKGGKHHCQGITVDNDAEFMYFSFTTKLVKTDLNGNVIGSVIGIWGHLGCIDYCDKDGKIYASLEYKNDAIGEGILKTSGGQTTVNQTAFYIAIFDGAKINRLDMDAEKDEVLKVVYLKEVVDDFNAESKNFKAQLKHRYACSGIDGIAIGTDFGSNKDSQNYLNVCYGIYGDIKRKDNDYQIILQYDINQLNLHAHSLKALPQEFIKHRNKYFVYTGNTNYGIQNLEYDAYTGHYLAAVYAGNKQNFTNFNIFTIDGTKKAKLKKLKGFKNEKGLVLSLAKLGEKGKHRIYGSFFEYGATGMYSFGNGYYYFSLDGFDGENYYTNSKLFKFVGGKKLFEENK